MKEIVRERCRQLRLLPQQILLGMTQVRRPGGSAYIN